MSRLKKDHLVSVYLLVNSLLKSLHNPPGLSLAHPRDPDAFNVMNMAAGRRTALGVGPILVITVLLDDERGTLGDCRVMTLQSPLKKIHACAKTKKGNIIRQFM